MTDPLGNPLPRSVGGRRGWGPWLRASIGATDAVMLLIALGVAYGVRFQFDDEVNVTGPFQPSYLLVVPAIGLSWWLVLGLARSREPGVLGHGPQELQRLVTGTARTFAVIAVVGFVTQWQVSRIFLFVAFPLGIVLLLAGRSAWRFWIIRRRDAGALQSNVLIVGSATNVEALERRFRAARRAGFRVVGVASVPGHVEDWSDLDGRIVRIGELVDPVAQARALNAGAIVVAGNEAMSFRESRQLGWALEGSGIELLVAPSLVDVAGPRVRMAPVAGLPLLSVSSPTFVGAKYVVKAMLDRIGAVLLLLVLSVPMIAIAIAVRATSSGPALFKQERLGLDMRPFQMYKFRSMFVDAESRLKDLLESTDGNGRLFKMKNDPRVTPVGRVLRRFSLDELPQLLNVLKGDMSLVGPRPPLAREAQQWEENVERRQLVKPGMTGLWQVSGRSDLSWEESVRLDLYYADNWTLGGDVLIILRTIYTVLKPRGAY
ncbi:sugar transferase [Demequina capsici]|uniref:Sugar transferase n=1 Tax=Demequina capsici TaxID=3075620 RepID=A0AA96FBK8_9MICO|nr:sugar transferase [Demequina sp. PMTSA13]WNM27801.1 sugar transferase [Demequina sp. PMTSA13]